jgi:hypothetical protein
MTGLPPWQEFSLLVLQGTILVSRQESIFCYSFPRGILKIIFIFKFRGKSGFRYEQLAEERRNRVPKVRCYDFKNIFDKKFGENIGIFCSNYS